ARRAGATAAVEPLVESWRAMVRVPDQPGHRSDQLEGGAGPAPGGGEPEGLGRQPHPGGRARPRGPDVGAGDVPPAGACGAGSCQPHASLLRELVASPTGAATNALNKYVRPIIDRRARRCDPVPSDDWQRL